MKRTRIAYFLLGWRIAALAVAITSGLVNVAEAQQGIKPRMPSTDGLFVDPNWEPNPGDRLDTTKDSTPACIDYDSYQRYIVSLKANDLDGLEKTAGGVVNLPKGTAVLVLRGFRPEKPRRGITTTNTDEYLRSFMNMKAAPDYSASPVEVRVLEGAAKGSVRLIPESFLAFRTKPPEPHGYTIVEGPGVLERHFFPMPGLPRGDRNSKPELRAANLYQRGIKAEGRGNAGIAIACFHRLVSDHPELPEGKNAALHLEAMGVTRLKDGNYLLDPSTRNPRRRTAAKATENASDPAKRAATMLMTAKNLEKLNKTKAAIETYRRLIKDYPETPQAKDAKARVEELSER